MTVQVWKPPRKHISQNAEVGFVDLTSHCEEAGRAGVALVKVKGPVTCKDHSLAKSRHSRADSYVQDVEATQVVLGLIMSFRTSVLATS